MLSAVNLYLQKIMPYITPAAVVIGVLLNDWLSIYVFLVPWIFAFMTFSGSLGSNFHDLRNVMRHPLSLIICLVVLHLIMPLIALGAGKILFPGDEMTTIGLVLSFVIPTGITSLIWVAIYKGNVVLTLSIILIDTLLAPFIVPLVLQVLVGNRIEMSPVDIMAGLLWMIVIPSILGMCVNQWMNPRKTRKLEANLAPFTKIGIGTVVAINSSAVAPYLKNIDVKLLLVALTVFFLAVLAYYIGYLSGKLSGLDRASNISLTFNSGMRNISGGAVIAITYFPPPAAVPVIVGMLFQQVLASLTGSLLSKRDRAGKKESRSAG
ncbi:bile acid:sodium symporter family protein [Halobacillus massiliensis]|uniref:bile acid:sodium symporter family protein n=1 Tax=Halobacillus massiliensis TaxID=1926286 RepID=UPI0009E3AD6C|nr:bile acid:sodium symporter family protein [Halobacillus massiliensis]